MARSWASRSSGVLGCTKCDTSAMCTPSSQWPLSCLLERDRVVEVAGVDRVDRDDRLAGEIAAAVADRFVELLGLLAGFCRARLRRTRPAGRTRG